MVRAQSLQALGSSHAYDTDADADDEATPTSRPRTPRSPARPSSTSDALSPPVAARTTTHGAYMGSAPVTPLLLGGASGPRPAGTSPSGTSTPLSPL